MFICRFAPFPQSEHSRLITRPQMTEHIRNTLAPGLLINPVLKGAAERAAALEHCSVTALIEKLLTDYLRRNGYLPRHPGADEGMRPHELTSDNDG